MSATSSQTSTQVTYEEQHAILHRSVTYMAHKSFLASTTWDTLNEHSTKTLFDCNTLSPYVCIITGAVSKHNYHMSTMGDCKLVGEPPQPSVPLIESQLRFSLEEPTDPSQAAYIPDFKKIVEVVQDAIDAIPGDGEKGGVSPFLTRSEDSRWLLNFDFRIFGIKDWRPEIADDPLELETYAIPVNYHPFSEDFGYRYRARRFPLWDYNGDAVDPDDYDIMKGSLVQVHVKLTHSRISGLKAEITRISVIGPYDD